MYNRILKEWYVSFLVKKKVKYNAVNPEKWVSVDPGEKCFGALYNPFDNEGLLICTDSRDQFQNSTIDKLQRKLSKRTTCTNNLKRALQRARNRNKNLQTELHYKLANYLCSNFKHIVIPSYKTKEMTLGKKTNRSVRNLAFYKFLQFLKHKCSERKVSLYITDEYFTTQACCRCGCLNRPNDRKYTCKRCALEIHRDLNGAVNIALKNLQ